MELEIAGLEIAGLEIAGLEIVVRLTLHHVRLCRMMGCTISSLKQQTLYLSGHLKYEFFVALIN